MIVNSINLQSQPAQPADVPTDIYDCAMANMHNATARNLRKNPSVARPQGGLSHIQENVPRTPLRSALGHTLTPAVAGSLAKQVI